MFPDLPWLEPPASSVQVTFPDLDAASDGPLDDLATRWVDGVWAAWSIHHDAVRAKASALAATFVADRNRIRPASRPRSHVVRVVDRSRQHGRRAAVAEERDLQPRARSLEPGLDVGEREALAVACP